MPNSLWGLLESNQRPLDYEAIPPRVSSPLFVVPHSAPRQKLGSETSRKSAERRAHLHGFLHTVPG